MRIRDDICEPALRPLGTLAQGRRIPVLFPRKNGTIPPAPIRLAHDVRA
jgi:hypothetical protein